MKKHLLFLIPLTALLIFTACQKELSVELSGTASFGSLQADAGGDCLPKTVQGVYEEGVSLDADSNFIDVQVGVSTVGTYRVYSDTVNGFFFESKGTFASAGLNTVRIKGNGTPLAEGVHNFTIRYDSSECTVPITTIPPGGALDSAEFTLAGSPDVCMNYLLAGDYIAGVAMTGANTVTISVDVSVKGTYNISTLASNGISFSGTGAFTNLGAQTVTLTASGTPIVAASTNIPLEAGDNNCSFSVDVAAATNGDNYFPTTAASNWSYQYDGDTNDSLFIRAKTGTVTLAGNAYNIFEATPDAAAGFGDYGAYRKTGSDYHTYVDLFDLFVIDASTPVDYIFLKDNVAASTSWETNPINVTASGVPLSFKIVNTVEHKDITITVGGTDYPNTIVVIEKYQLLNVATWVDLTDQVGYIKSYYAKNIGLIKQDFYEANNTPNPPVTLQMDLRRYQIF